MSAIAGFVHTEGVTLMADSAACNNDCLVFASATPKLIRLGDALVGVAGGVRLTQLLEYRGPAPTPIADDPVHELVTWASEVRSLALTFGLLRSKEGVEELGDNRLLVAYRGRLFEIDAALAVVEPAVPYWSIGCGQAETRAAMHALAASLGGAPDGETAETILTRAMRATAAFNAHVCAPFVTQHLFTRLGRSTP